MFYRVIVDCRPSDLGSRLLPFITAKFVESVDQSEAAEKAIAKTKVLMAEKGLTETEIAAHEFLIEEVCAFDRDEAEFSAEGSFAYYTDD